MEEKTQSNQNQTGDDLDRMLDAALAEYAAVEPRAGLEERILASLRTQEARRHGAWWQWSFAAVAAMVLIVALAVAWRWSRPSAPAIVRQAPTVIQPEPQKKEVAKQDAAKRPRQIVRPRAVRPSTEQRVAADGPKLDQFPSPQPLSEEEMALARYVRNFPGEAQLVAKAQEASAREVLRKMEAQANESAESN